MNLFYGGRNTAPSIQHGAQTWKIISVFNVRRKFRSQTSDKMDRWKVEVEQKNREEKRREEKRRKRREEKRSEAKRSEEKRREEKKREDQRRESLRRKKIQEHEKVGKSRNTVFFQWFVAPEGRKVGSLKRRVRSQLARWEINNYTPLWLKADFEIKMYKTHQVRTTFGSWDVEKAHAVVAWSTFRSQNAQNTPCSDHFWKLRCRKSARRCGAKHISKSKC